MDTGILSPKLLRDSDSASCWCEFAVAHDYFVSGLAWGIRELGDCQNT